MRAKNSKRGRLVAATFVVVGGAGLWFFGTDRSAPDVGSRAPAESSSATMRGAEDGGPIAREETSARIDATSVRADSGYLTTPNSDQTGPNPVDRAAAVAATDVPALAARTAQAEIVEEVEYRDGLEIVLVAGDVQVTPAEQAMRIVEQVADGGGADAARELAALFRANPNREEAQIEILAQVGRIPDTPDSRAILVDALNATRPQAVRLQALHVAKDENLDLVSPLANDKDELIAHEAAAILLERELGTEKPAVLSDSGG